MSVFCLHRGTRRRGSVLVMVVAVLAMLFIIGTSQLMMARFERKLANERGLGTQAKETAGSAVVPPAINFGEDVLGVNGLAYDRSWNQLETSPIEDDSDFVGTPVFLPTDTPAIRLQKAARAGDLLVSSPEPYYGTDANGISGWMYPFMSWSKDAITDITELPGSIEMSSGSTPIVGRSPLKAYRILSEPFSGDYYLDTATGQFCADVDGDGVVDGRWVGSMAGCSLYQRIISHGGMVTLDRMTHPALLSQVIHPSDTLYHNQPWLLFGGGDFSWNGTFNASIKAEDEGRLRRRYMLPGSTIPSNEPNSDWMKLLAGDLRKLLPYTLGYLSPKDSNTPPHYWRVGNPPDGMNITPEMERDWWQSRIAPVTSSNGVMDPLPGLTEAGYSPAKDTYDRRHLLTMHNNDDLLRPIRDEKRLLQLPGYLPETATSTFVLANAEGTPTAASLYHVLNPETEGGPNTTFTALEKQGRPMPGGVPLGYGMMRYNNGMTWSLEFNKPGLRTPFSLRDTLVNPTTNRAVDNNYNVLGWGYQASYHRCVQLMAYYLAMIQHTTVLGTAAVYDGSSFTSWLTSYSQATTEQLKTAAQLAVNTIDFADNADVNGDGVVDADDTVDTTGRVVDPVTCFTYVDPTTSNIVEVCGFERQPFITEAYARIVYGTRPKLPSGFEWDPSTEATYSIYAIELTNPYADALPLNDFVLRVDSNEIDFSEVNISIPARSAIVLANRIDDPTTDTSPFITGAQQNVNLFVVGSDVPGTLAIHQGSTITLERKTALKLEINKDTRVPQARLERDARLVVDRIMPETTGLGMDGNGHAIGERFAAPPNTAVRGPILWNEGEYDSDAKDLLVSDSSIQRRKNVAYWQCTLSRQMVFPLPWYEDTRRPGFVADDDWDGTRALPSSKPNCPPQHNLLGTADWLIPAADRTALITTNQHIVAAEMDGIAFEVTGVNGTLTYDGSRALVTGVADTRRIVSTIVPYRKYPVAPCPLVTSDLGLDALDRNRAFPTTGTLLLVSRYAHIKDGLNYSPVTEAVVSVPSMNLGNQNRSPIEPALPYASPYTQLDGDYNDAVGQMQMPDNGHLPVFDGPRYNGPLMTSTTNPGQIVLGTSTVTGTPGESRRSFMPWGQLVFSYFTALPIQELFVYRNLSAVVTGATNVRAVDLAGADYDNAYKYIVNGMLVNDYLGSYPVVEALVAGGSTTVGPRVRGRVNINTAPWWVLDGLPVLPNQYLLPGHVDYGLFNSLPVPELFSGALDAAVAGATIAAHQTLEGVMVQDPNNWATRFTDAATKHNAGASTLGPDMAAFMVSYRENRSVRNVSVTPLPPRLQALARNLDVSLDRVGFVGLGALCDVVQRMPVSSSVKVNGFEFSAETPLGNLRHMLDPSASAGPAVRKPYSYYGYLQMIAPVVRLQDWMTTKSHVYTIYNLVGDDNGAWLRSQATIDRTRCLYTNDLPDKITATNPINYFNVMGDQ